MPNADSTAGRDAPGVTLSVVVPVMNERENVGEVHRRLRDVLAAEGLDFEILFVDDGSTDGTDDAVAALHEKDPRVKLLSFSRNFGHQIALTAGMDHVDGDVIVMMDGDLQHPPELIPELLARWREGNEIVYTVRRTTEKEGYLKRTASRLFYRFFRWMTRLDLPAKAADFRLVDRQVLESLTSIRERSRFLRGLTRWVGYRSIGVEYDAPARTAGESKYNLRRQMGLAIDAVTSFSTRPLHLAIYVGIIEALLGFAYGIYAIIRRLFYPGQEPGWASVVVLVAVLGGIHLSLTGVIGLYIGKVFEEVKQRPLYLVRRRVGLGETQGGSA